MKKLNKILDYLSEFNLNKDKNISSYFDKIKDKGRTITTKGITGIEIKKHELELTKKYYNLGNYIAKKYYSDKILDFSYDEEYKSMNEKIVSLKNYLNKLKNNS